jgi:hypothetical protein
MITANDQLGHPWRDAANLILGIWLALSPTVLAYVDEDIPALNSTVVGVIIALLATAALLKFARWEEWLNVALGAWLIVSPFVLGYATHTETLANQIMVGLLVCCLALWSALAKL